MEPRALPLSYTPSPLSVFNGEHSSLLPPNSVLQCHPHFLLINYSLDSRSSLCLSWLVSLSTHARSHPVLEDENLGPVTWWCSLYTSAFFPFPQGRVGRSVPHTHTLWPHPPLRFLRPVPVPVTVLTLFQISPGDLPALVLFPFLSALALSPESCPSCSGSCETQVFLSLSRSLPSPHRRLFLFLSGNCHFGLFLLPSCLYLVN